MKKLKISISEYRLLEALLQREYSLKDALDFLIDDQKKIQFEKIRTFVRNGEKIKLEENNFEKEITFYLQYVSLAKAINIALNNYQRRKERKKKIVNNCAYSFLLIIASFGLLTLFSKFVLPNMISSFEIDDELLLIKIVYFLNNIKDIFLVILGIVLLIIIYCFITKKIRLLWGLLHEYNLDNLFKEMATISLATKLVILLDNGISIKDSLSITIKSKSLDGLLAYRLDEHLSEGYNLEATIKDEYLDNAFFSLCLFGIKEKNFLTGIKNYLVLKEQIINERIKKISIILQIISYGLVGLILIVMYQVLLLPLESLGGFL